MLIINKDYLDKKQSGLYHIINNISDNKYIGITDNFSIRWKNHRSDLIKGYKNKDNINFTKNNSKCRHHQLYLQLEFNKFYEEYKEEVWEKVYTFKAVIEVPYTEYDKRVFEKIEDEYILKAREKCDGYYQKTNYENLYLYKWVENNDKIELVNTIHKNKENIINMYLEDKKKYYEIAKIYDTSTSRIMKYLIKWGVETRGISESVLGFDINKEKEDIINLYIIQNKSAKYISDLYGTSSVTIGTYLSKWNIELKTDSEIQIGFNILNFKDEIIDLYVNKKSSTLDIGRLFNVSKRCINNNLKKWEIKIRTAGETLSYNQTGSKRYNSIYVEAIDEFGNIQVFGSATECARWMVDMGLTETTQGSSKAIAKSFKNNKKYKGYIFKKYTKNEYENNIKKAI